MSKTTHGKTKVPILSLCFMPANDSLFQGLQKVRKIVQIVQKFCKKFSFANSQSPPTIKYFFSKTGHYFCKNSCSNFYKTVLQKFYKNFLQKFYKIFLQKFYKFFLLKFYNFFLQKYADFSHWEQTIKLPYVHLKVNRGCTTKPKCSSPLGGAPVPAAQQTRSVSIASMGKIGTNFISLLFLINIQMLCGSTVVEYVGN